MELEPYDGTWSDDDPDAGFKAQVAEYSRNDPMPTLETLADNTGIPVGALARYILVRWAAEGSETLLALGPRTVQRMVDVAEEAERRDTDEARLEAFAVLRSMLSWLAAPLR